MLYQFAAASVWLVALVTACTAEPMAGDIKLNPKDGQQYAWIPAGTFRSQQATTVNLSQGSWMGRTEVTVAAYKRFVRDTGESMPPESEWNPGFRDDQKPIVRVTWDEAGLFCAWAGGRVPSESEWEYAARSGNESDVYGELDAIAWYGNNSGRKGSPSRWTEAGKCMGPAGHVGQRLGMDDGSVSANRKE